jgi:hypothetical protein
MSEPPRVAQLKKKEGGKVLVSDNNSNRKGKIGKVLLLGSSDDRGLREHLHSVLWGEYMVKNIFKPSAVLGSVVGELKALSKYFTTDDHVIVLGGPGNSLDMDPNYKN